MTTEKDIIEEVLKEIENKLKNVKNYANERFIDVTIKNLKDVLKEYEKGMEEIIKEIYSFYELQKDNIVTKEFIDGVLSGEMGGEYEDDILNMFQDKISELQSKLEKEHNLSEIEHEEDYIKVSKFNGLFCVYVDNYGEVEIDWLYEKEFKEAIELGIQSQKQKIEGWEKLFEEEQTSREQAQEEIRNLKEELKSQKQKIIEEIKRVFKINTWKPDNTTKVCKCCNGWRKEVEELLNSLGEKQ